MRAGAHHPTSTGWFLLLLVVIFLLYVGWRSGRLAKTRRAIAELRLRGELNGVRIRPVALLPTLLLVIVVVVLLINH